MIPLFKAARLDLLPEANTQASIVPRLVILHTNAGASSTNGFQLRAYMARPDVTLECHFQVDLDGTVHQFMPIDVRADCNYQANPFAVSIETQDFGAATVDSSPWTAAQFISITQLLAWLNTEAGIPLVRATAWNGSGVGAHRDFPQWSAAAHSCPGNARFAQVPGLISAAVNYRDPPVKGRRMSHCKDALTGKFWYFGRDSRGAAFACPIDELPDAGNWDTYGPIEDIVNGPLVVVDHAVLQRMYDVRGKPYSQVVLPLVDHKHLPGGVAP